MSHAPGFIDSMSAARRPTGPVAAIVVVIAGLVLAGIPPLFFGVNSEGSMSFSSQLIMTSSFLVWIMVLAAWVKFKEQRPVLPAFGLRSPAGKNIACGALAGCGLTTIVVIINVALGSAHLGALQLSAFGAAAFLLIGFAIQATAEEIGYRYYLVPVLAAKKWPMGVIVVVQAVLFTAGHVGNGLNPVAVLSMLAVSYLTVMWMLATGNIFGAAAFHTAWNWSQANVWGSNVSNVAVDTSVLHYTTTPGMDLLSGGAFGLEGSLMTVVLLLAGGAYFHRRCRGQQHPQRSRLNRKNPVTS